MSLIFKGPLWESVGPIYKGKQLANNLRCVTSQKSEDPIHTAAEAWNQNFEAMSKKNRADWEKSIKGAKVRIGL